MQRLLPKIIAPHPLLIQKIANVHNYAFHVIFMVFHGLNVIEVIGGQR